MVQLSILIPTIIGRESSLNAVLMDLEKQCGGIDDIGVFPSKEDEAIFCHYYPNNVQCIVYEDDSKISIGEKRNSLLEIAKGEYISFVDDDDLLFKNYIKLLMEGIEQKVDCCSLKGIITMNGGMPDYFEHSIRYNEYKTNLGAEYNNGQIKYERFPNHLSCIKSEIAKAFKFPEKNWGEDTDWATQIHKSGLLKTEHYISEVIYYYKYISHKKQKQQQ
jgi:glycosyltransferase involved in cell wall biosynthesis